MSVKLMALIWDHGPKNQSERFVLLALADHANDEGLCWPSIARIAAKCCMSERAVRRIIRRLEEGGWLTTVVGGGRHGCNNYRINPDPRSPLTLGPPGPSIPKTRTLDPKNPDLGSPEPSRTIKEPARARTRPPDGPPALPADSGRSARQSPQDIASIIADLQRKAEKHGKGIERRPNVE